MTRGRVLSLERGWLLAKEWYRDRLSPEWRRKTPEEFEAVFSGLGLIDPFWRL